MPRALCDHCSQEVPVHVPPDGDGYTYFYRFHKDEDGGRCAGTGQPALLTEVRIPEPNPNRHSI